MTKLLMGLCFALLASFSVQAQKKHATPSKEIIKKGIELHDSGKYKEAIEVYRKVNRNDSNYVLALYEIALSQNADSNFISALETCSKGLLQEEKSYELQFYILKANTLDEIGKTSEALACYDSALLRYPNAEMLLLNKAITLQRLKEHSEATSILQGLLIKNPYFASAHFRLAQCALQQGKIVPAFMSLYTYQLVKPNGNFRSAVIKAMSGISKAQEDMLQFASQKNEEEEYAYAVLEKIILSKIALDKNYKLLTRFDDPLFRQLQVMLEKLEYKPGNPDFWMQFYVPVFKAIYKNNQTEAAIYHAFSDLDIEAIQQYVKKNGKEIKEMIQTLTADFNKIRETGEIDYSKRKSAEPIYFFEDGVCFAQGKLLNGKPSGSWTYFFNNGNIRSKGQFDANGKKDGKWTYYFNPGGISGYEDWRNGVQWGEDLTYNKKGLLVNRSNYVNGKLDGEKHIYYNIGVLREVSTYRDGNGNGKYVKYYLSGTKKIEATLSDDQLDGLYTSYYQNGKPEVKGNYIKGKINGDYNEFFDDGSISYKGVYNNGEPEGEHLTYHKNGKLKRKAVYKKGFLDGDEMEYDSDGKPSSKITYKNGKADGLAEYFYEGRLYSTILFEKDRLKQVKYFDVKGKEISSASRQGKEFTLVTYTPSGFKNSQVKVDEKDMKQGEMKYFFHSGATRENYFYKDNQLEGTGTTYLIADKKHVVSEYSAGKKNGLYQSYFANGVLKNEGWYEDDEISGEWIEYNEKGKIQSKSYYLSGELHGIREIYFANGQLDYEERYNNGWIESFTQYDTLGKVIASATFPKSTGPIRGVFFNGKKRFEGTYANGQLEGPYTLYYINGNVQQKKSFVNGLLHGVFTGYHYNGKKSSEGLYEQGNKTGIWKYYHENGAMFKEENYVRGELEGEQKIYHENGKVERLTQFKEGEKYGSMTRYAESGQVMSIFYFRNDKVYGYSYHDKNNQPVPTIELPGGTGKVITYYSNGTKSSEMEYIEGLMHGQYKMYFPDGKLYYSSEEYYNTTNGKIEEYYANGKKKSGMQYYYDNQDGIVRMYHENGNLKEEGNCYNGYYNGWYTYFDATGKPIEKQLYYYGLIINFSK